MLSALAGIVLFSTGCEDKQNKIMLSAYQDFFKKKKNDWFNQIDLGSIVIKTFYQSWYF